MGWPARWGGSRPLYIQPPSPTPQPPPSYPFFLGGGWRPTFRPLFSIDHPFPTALVGLAQHRPVRPEIENSFSDSFSACAASVPIFRVSRVCVCVTECVPRECVGNERNLSNEWLFWGEKLFQKRKKPLAVFPVVSSEPKQLSHATLSEYFRKISLFSSAVETNFEYQVGCYVVKMLKHLFPDCVGLNSN